MKISKNSKGIGWEKENNISIDEVDLTSYAKKTDLPTKTSELTNDSGFTTSNDVDKMIYENLNDCNIIDTMLDYINIKKYSHLVQNDDWTIAINTAISEAISGATIYFPIGRYNHKGITITKSINIVGNNKYSTILTNVGDGDSIVISDHAERGTIREIGIFGNGTFGNPVDATSKKGIVFGNYTCCWRFDSIWMRNHGDYYFYAEDVGHINNIIICNSELESGAKSCIRFYQSSVSSQINAIYIQNCNISGFLRNGIEVWGQNINIASNTIQNCKNVGISVIADESESNNLFKSNSHTQGLVITNNYFELCYNGFMSFKGCTQNGKLRGIYGANVIGNYGDYYIKSGDTFDSTSVAVVSIVNNDTYITDNDIYTPISNFVYMGNAFGKGSAQYILKSTGIMYRDNLIQVGNIGTNNLDDDIMDDYYGIERCTILGKMINNVTYKFPLNSNVDTDLLTNLNFREMTYINFQHNIQEIIEITIEIETDADVVHFELYDNDTVYARSGNVDVVDGEATYTKYKFIKPRVKCGKAVESTLLLKILNPNSNGTYYKIKSITYRM